MRNEQISFVLLSEQKQKQKVGKVLQSFYEYQTNGLTLALYILISLHFTEINDYVTEINEMTEMTTSIARMACYLSWFGLGICLFCV